MANRKGAKDAKENDFFRIGTRRRLWLWRGKRTIRKRFQPSGQSANIAGPLVLKYRRCPLQRLVGSSCPVVARRAKPEADRLFSFADLRIGKRKLSVLGVLSEAGGSSFSLGHLAPVSKDLSAMRITL